MLLHNEKSVFLEVNNGAANYYAIPEEQIEKDYYVSHLLSHLVKIVPEIDNLITLHHHKLDHL